MNLVESVLPYFPFLLLQVDDMSAVQLNGSGPGSQNSVDSGIGGKPRNHSNIQVYCTVVHSTLYTTHCTLLTAHCIMWPTAHCTLHSPLPLQRSLPAYARVKQARVPNAYDPKALRLEVRQEQCAESRAVEKEQKAMSMRRDQITES